ncbi:hypothetical protein IW140_006417 [Coemansia sp. RSA 1813]|nr:hypothetical protein EV178_002225 [Coemansia sp. RSA 1646]KAJ1765602.1 hypothetical protein LPJ74_006282 [Coemansia sp. RSA 1843]KAJ2085344.1 hypothetical protein IW138_006379 [Coemansia sp. RSA 986]KAJ2217054.1 hypothetical protein EV179_000821 [Coemansia sp. RSA 487]KAJ2562457.1 hypothetical protein IW140_006417 [Coemansia sp. RSA 1813]
MTISVRRSARLLTKSVNPVTPVTPSSEPVGIAATGRISKAKSAKRGKDKGKQTASSASVSLLVANVGPSSKKARAKPECLFQSLADPGAMEEAIRFLRDVDPKLARIIDNTTEKCSMALSRDSKSDTSYISLCQSIIYQQLAGKAAEAILLRFLKRYGTLKHAASKSTGDQSSASSLTTKDFVFPSAEQVVEFDVDEMKAVGLGQRKAEYLKEVALNFSNGTLSEDMLAAMSDEEASRALVSIRGIGQWTADMFLMFHLKRPNVLPTLDLAIRKAMCQHFGVPFGKKTPTHDQMVKLGEIWEPYRSVATWYMWRSLNTVTQDS